MGKTTARVRRDDEGEGDAMVGGDAGNGRIDAVERRIDRLEDWLRPKLDGIADLVGDLQVQMARAEAATRAHRMKPPAGGESADMEAIRPNGRRRWWQNLPPWLPWLLLGLIGGTRPESLRLLIAAAKAVAGPSAP